MRPVRVLKYVLIGVAGLYLLAAILYAVPVISGALDDTMEVRFSRPDPSLVADYRNGLTPETGPKRQPTASRMVGSRPAGGSYRRPDCYRRSAWPRLPPSGRSGSLCRRKAYSHI